jgi:hypothetical protein
VWADGRWKPTASSSGRTRSWAAVLCISLAAVRGDDSISPEAVAYIDAALTVMRQHYLHRGKIDWTKLRQENT